MKLDKYTKQAIVRQILDDVPKPDEQTVKEQIQKALYKGMSPACKRLYDQKPHALSEVYVDQAHGLDNHAYVKRGDADVDAILKPFRKAADELYALKTELRLAIEACNTRKQFVDRFPEFIKYAPPEAGKTPNLPAVANLVANLVKAGWKQTVFKGDEK